MGQLVEVEGLIPGGLIGIFLRLNLSGRTMTLGSTQFLNKSSTRRNPWGVKAAGA